VLAAGRAAFFGDATSDLPEKRSPLLAADDRTPQFGYVGAEYLRARVLLLGINPGKGKETEVRSRTDARMMPALVQFAQHPSHESFIRAQQAYKVECQTWHIWKRHCNEVIGAGKLSLEEIAYSNCLPWRTDSDSAFGDAVGERAATLYAHPLIEELRPLIVIAMGKTAANILRCTGKQLPHLIVWNRAQAPNPAVLEARDAAAAEVFHVLGRRQ